MRGVGVCSRAATGPLGIFTVPPSERTELTMSAADDGVTLLG
eukprot:COSAG02_NODE_2544_length_8566_cov_180.516712_3_plen_42_part_00